jgi:hypothetical protein
MPASSAHQGPPQRCHDAGGGGVIRIVQLFAVIRSRQFVHEALARFDDRRECALRHLFADVIIESCGRRRQYLPPLRKVRNFVAIGSSGLSDQGLPLW